MGQRSHSDRESENFNAFHIKCNLKKKEIRVIHPSRVSTQYDLSSSFPGPRSGVGAQWSEPFEGAGATTSPTWRTGVGGARVSGISLTSEVFARSGLGRCLECFARENKWWKCAFWGWEPCPGDGWCCPLLLQGERRQNSFNILTSF